MEILETQRYGYGFVSAAHLPPGKDEYWIRNIQAASLFGERAYRALTADETAALEQNGCRSGCWADVLVSNPFDPALVRNSAFYGLVRLGRIENKLLRHHDFCVPAGIRNSMIISSDIGDDVSVQDCALISHYIIAPRCILSRVDELVNTNHAKYGNGIVKEGENEDVRVWIDVMNEAGGRSILPFADMIPADAYLWAAFRDDTALVQALKTITQNTQGIPFGGMMPRTKTVFRGEIVSPRETGKAENAPRTERRGFYGTIGTGTVIKSCRIIKDTAIGEAAYIKGANKLKNLSVLSSEDETTQIGEGVELVNGIVGYGCRVFYGAKAVRFVLGRRSSLKYGARLVHSVLGDNSTVSCCEILNNLVFPVHEQHHNNSFLIASLIEGMSNMAAGATVGSNHNSRANDGEIRAGRGFWPGLSVTLKHNSRLASFCLIARGNFPYELNIPLPFSLVNNNVRDDRLEVMPAYFWLYNLYALERNSWKSQNRDRRIRKIQRIETDYLAPDTAEEIIDALELMETWMKTAGMSGTETDNGGFDCEDEDPEYDYGAALRDGVLPASGLERHSRPSVILKPRRAMAAYRNMLFFYAMKTLIARAEKITQKKNAAVSFEELTGSLSGEASSGSDGTQNAETKGRVTGWINLGGQIVPSFRLDALRKDIREGTRADWDAIHAAYDAMAAAYENDKACHARAVLAYLGGGMTREAFIVNLEKTVRLSAWICEQVRQSRAKDFNDPFKGITYRNGEEMEQVVGRAKDNSFIKLVEKNHREFTERIETLKKNL